MCDNMFQRTLIITPHCDDETIGCGGLIHSLLKRGCEVLVYLISTHDRVYNVYADRVVSHAERLQEMRDALDILAVHRHDVPLTLDFPKEIFIDGKLDVYPLKQIVTCLDSVIKRFKPTAVLFPYGSHHQDHQVVCRASIAALRSTIDTNFIKLRAAYEYPYVTSAWDNTLNVNNRVYYVLDEFDMSSKRLALEKYKSQLNRGDPRDILSIDSISNLAVIRGTEIGQNYAEVFYPINVIFNNPEVKEESL